MFVFLYYNNDWFYYVVQNTKLQNKTDIVKFICYFFLFAKY